MPTSTAGRWFGKLNRSIDCRKHWPSVIEMTLVGMCMPRLVRFVSMIGRPVIEPPPISSLELRAARGGGGRTSPPGYASRTRRAAQQQRHGAVGLGLRGRRHDQTCLPLVHPVLADGRAGVGGDVLEARGGPRRGRMTIVVYSIAPPPRGGSARRRWSSPSADGDVDAVTCFEGSPDSQCWPSGSGSCRCRSRSCRSGGRR